jgi:hypothetical protein
MNNFPKQNAIKNIYTHIANSFFCVKSIQNEKSKN